MGVKGFSYLLKFIRLDIFVVFQKVAVMYRRKRKKNCYNYQEDASQYMVQFGVGKHLGFFLPWIGASKLTTGRITNFRKSG